MFPQNYFCWVHRLDPTVVELQPPLQSQSPTNPEPPSADYVLLSHMKRQNYREYSLPFVLGRGECSTAGLGPFNGVLRIIKKGRIWSK